jgi:hypothetical protein
MRRGSGSREICNLNRSRVKQRDVGTERRKGRGRRTLQPGGSLASLAALAAAACTTVVGLPDLPGVDQGGGAARAGAGGATSSGGSAMGGSSGEGNEGGDGSPARGGSGLGGATSSGGTSATGGTSANGGTAGAQGGSSGSNDTGGSSGSGGTGTGGVGTAGSGTGGGGAGNGGASGSAGSDPGCSPACDVGAICESGECVCAQGFTECPDGCADLESDRNNCGECSRFCDDGCAAGECYREILAELDETPRIAIDATYIYFTQGSAGTVSRIARNGSGLRVLAASQDRPIGIAVDTDNVYWVNQTTFQGRVMKQSLGGGDPVELANSELYPEDIAVDGTHVYWTNRAGTGSIVRVPIDGGSKTVLASGAGLVNTYHLAIDDTHVYWTNGGDGAYTGSVMRVPLAGGTAEPIAPNIDSPSAITVYENQVYFTNGGFNEPGLRRISTAGGTISTITLGSVGWESIAVDATGVYAVGAGPRRDRLIRYSHDGSSERILAASSTMDAVVVDATEVIWASGSGTGIRAVPKPP